MKKIFLVLTLLFLSGCSKPTIDPTSQAMFEKFIEELPSEITCDYELPKLFNDSSILWEHEGNIINSIDFYYTTVEKEVTLKSMVEQNNKVLETEKIFKIKASPFVYKLNLTTKNNLEVTSKEEYLEGTIQVDSTDVFKTEPIGMEIRGRGNSTWMFDKKPYRIKMSERTSLLGLKAVKNYVLLAEFTDKSLMRNYLAHQLSKMLNLDYTLDTRYVEVYFNGRYDGLYLMTEQVKEDKNGLNITVDESFDSGFLIELEADERLASEGLENEGWVRVNGNNYLVKDPDLSDFDDSVRLDKVSYIKTFINTLELTLNSHSYDMLVDMDVLIDYFIIYELFKAVDIGYSSVYSYKRDSNSKLMMGPIWDFDISLGNGDYFDSSYQGYWVDYNDWFRILLTNEAFEARYIERFNEVIDVYFDDLIEILDQSYDGIKEAAQRNFTRWTILDEYVWPNPPAMVNIHTHLGQVEYIRSFLINRSAWLINELNTKGLYTNR